MFMSVHRVCSERGYGPRAAKCFLKMSVMVHFCNLEKDSQNQHVKNILLVGRGKGTKNSTLCTVLMMLTILDDPKPGR